MLYLKERDPHLYREFSDPVYQIKLTQTHGQTLSKLRKGDGNDVTPNPMKLYQLGKQIRDLLKNTSSLYHGIYHHVEHSSNANDTVEAKKEKNKLASKYVLKSRIKHSFNAYSNCCILEHAGFVKKHNMKQINLNYRVSMTNTVGQHVFLS
jgi:hypothetical protein